MFLAAASLATCFSTSSFTRATRLHWSLYGVLRTTLWHLWTSSRKLRHTRCGSHTSSGWWHWEASGLWCTRWLLHHHWHRWGTTSWHWGTSHRHLRGTCGSHASSWWWHWSTSWLWSTWILHHWDQHGRFTPWRRRFASNWHHWHAPHWVTLHLWGTFWAWGGQLGRGASVGRGAGSGGGALDPSLIGGINPNETKKKVFSFSYICIGNSCLLL